MCCQGVGHPTQRISGLRTKIAHTCWGIAGCGSCSRGFVICCCLLLFLFCLFVCLFFWGGGRGEHEQIEQKAEPGPRPKLFMTPTFPNALWIGPTREAQTKLSVVQ